MMLFAKAWTLVMLTTTTASSVLDKAHSHSGIDIEGKLEQADYGRQQTSLDVSVIQLQKRGEKKDRPVTTIRASSSATDDVSTDFEQGLRRANHGGLLRLEAGKTYVIGKQLDLSWLDDVHVQLQGTIKFTDDIVYWQKNHISHPFQNSISFWRWGGSNVKIYGGGTLDGNGQKWWDGFANKADNSKKQDNPYPRPILFYAESMTNLEISDINFRNPPAWNSFFVDSKSIVVDRCNFTAKSSNRAVRPKNSDGLDTYNVNGMRITNCNLEVDDDCVAAKPNTTNLLVENLYCKGTHGVSMGSIGQYAGTMDYISNVLVKNVTLVDGTIGARLKAWAGKNVGYGYMRNITYRDIHVENTDNPIVLDQCYFGVKSDECKAYPSKVDIDDIHFINITGTSSGKKRGVMGSLRCSQGGATCKNIELRDIHLRSKNGASDRPVIHCDGIQNVTAGSCIGSRDRSNARTQPDNVKNGHRKKSAQDSNFVLHRNLLGFMSLLAVVCARL